MKPDFRLFATQVSVQKFIVFLGFIFAWHGILRGCCRLSVKFLCKSCGVRRTPARSSSRTSAPSSPSLCFPGSRRSICRWVWRCFLGDRTPFEVPIHGRDRRCVKANDSQKNTSTRLADGHKRSVRLLWSLPPTSFLQCIRVGFSTRTTARHSIYICNAAVFTDVAVLTPLRRSRCRAASGRPSCTSACQRASWRRTSGCMIRHGVIACSFSNDQRLLNLRGRCSGTTVC